MQKRFYICALFLVFEAFGTFIDNRYFPFFPKMYRRTFEKRSFLKPEFFMMFAHDSYGKDDKDIGLFEIWGDYNLKNIGNSLEAIGKTNPVLSEWRSVQDGLKFDWTGKIHTQGIWMSTEFAFVKTPRKTFSFGTRFAFMHAASNQNFAPSEQIQKDLHLDQGGLILLDQERRQASCELGLVGDQWRDFGMTDTDLYFRLSNMTEYIYKCRFIDVAGSLGVLLPTGVKRDINNPASVPFSANGHWGLYFLADLTAEVREDWYGGLWLDLVHRFKKKQELRLPRNNEPLPYGVIVGDFEVDPGFTIGFGIFAKIFDFNNGLGMGAKYQLVKHFEDCIRDCRKDKSIEIKKFNDVLDRTSWLSEYLSVEIMYDLSQLFCSSKFDSYFYANFDAPVHGLGSEQVAKTFKLSLGVEVDF